VRRTSRGLLRLCLLVVIGGTTFYGHADDSGAEFRASTTQRPAGVASLASDPLAEYPPWDRTVRDQHRAGLAVKKARQLLSEAPDTFETAEALLAIGPLTYQGQERIDDALRVIRAIFEKRPQSIAKTIEAMLYSSYAFESDGTRDRRPALRELLDLARRQLSGLSKSEAADLAYQVTRMQAWVERTKGGTPVETLKALMQEYAGTDAALEAELAILSRSLPYSNVEKRVEALARFSAEHRGTCAAAEALRMESTDVGSNMGTRGRSGEDPTERALRMIEIEEQLSSPAYASCRPTFGRGGPYAFASKPVYAPGNIDRLLAAYRGYFKTHLTAEAGDPGDGVGYLVTSVVRGLFRAKGEGVEALDRFLADLEEEVPEPDAARYLRAIIHEPITAREGVGNATAPQPPTVAQLIGLHGTGKGLYQRKALATLAWLYGFYGDTQKARQYYSEYVKQYPDSGYAWVAALRAAECAADLGDWKTAAAEDQAAARTYQATAIARVLARAYGARAIEALNDFQHAKGEYQAAVAGWDHDYDPRMTLATQRFSRPSADIVDPFRDPLEVTPLVLETRLAQLTRTLAAPGGAVLEQGRWLLDHGKRKEAAALLADFPKRYPKSPNSPEAQYLAHKARLYDALEMLNIEGESNETAGLAALEALAREPYDFPVTAANIARACVLWKQGKKDDAAKVMEEALEERVARQQVQEPASPLEKDVAAIRSLLFLPTGGPAYSGARGWNGFSWPATLPPFVVVNAQARVKAEGRVSNVTLYQRFPGLADVLLVNDEDLGFFSLMMNKVGGTKKRTPQAIMEVPNQPVGPSVNVMALLNKFFPMRPGHWGGWEFLTYPVITEIEFMNAGRTLARARVTIGYSGCDVLLEKAAGAWKATAMTNMWVT